MAGEDADVTSADEQRWLTTCCCSAESGFFYTSRRFSRARLESRPVNTVMRYPLQVEILGGLAVLRTVLQRGFSAPLLREGGCRSVTFLSRAGI